MKEEEYETDGGETEEKGEGAVKTKVQRGEGHNRTR